jgi:hypothetical protein
VVHRDADDGQADGQTDRDAHAVVAVDRLEGCVALIVVAGDDHVPLAIDCGGEERVRGDGSVHVDAVLAGNGGGEDVGVLVAEQAVLARVRVEPGEADRLVRVAECSREGADDYPRQGFRELEFLRGPSREPVRLVGQLPQAVWGTSHKKWL